MIGVTSHTTALKTLELFDEKAAELLSSRFFAEVGGGGAIVEFKKDSGWEAIHVGPDDESTRSLVLTLRLFMLNKDPTPFFPLFQSSLVDAIVTFGRCIGVLRHTNQRAMTELGRALRDERR